MLKIHITYLKSKWWLGTESNPHVNCGAGPIWRTQVKKDIGNVTGTSSRRISSDNSSDSWPIFGNFEALFPELSLSANDL